jgi:hypothetical protein
MRTPSDRPAEAGDLSPYAPRWARQSNEPPRPSALREDVAPEPEELVIGNVRVPASLTPRTLDPSPVPDPRTLRKRLRTRTSRLRIIGRALVATAIAGAAACYWVGVLPSPGRAGTEAAVDTPPEPPARSEQRSIERIAKLQERAPATSAVAPLVAPIAAAPAAPSATPAEPAAPAATAVPRTADPPAPAVASLPNATRTAPEPSAPALRKLDPDEVAFLVRRGEDFIETGDFASARPVLQRAAEAGNARAALILAGTFDPAVLQKVQVKGLAPDVAKARYWYEKAIDLGSSEAKGQLARLPAPN